MGDQVLFENDFFLNGEPRSFIELKTDSGSQFLSLDLHDW
jgi:hypothetical protein